VIFYVDITSSWTLRQRKRWHSQQSGINCFGFSRRTMPGLPEIRMNPSPQKLNGELPCPKSVDMACPMIALVSDAAHRAPHIGRDASLDDGRVAGLNTEKTLGITLSPGLRALADKVTE
jgi:hypothetical protein